MKTSKYYISTKIDNCVLYYNLVNDTLLSLPEALEEGCEVSGKSKQQGHNLLAETIQ